MKAKNLFALVLLSFCVASCGETPEPGPEPDPIHVHTFSSSWSSDATHHWHAATCEHTDLTKNKDTHTFSKWVVDREATFDTKGLKHRNCVICAYQENEEIELLPHHYSESWSADEEKGTHYHACTDIGYETLRSNEAEHTYEEETVLPSGGEKGYTEHTCLVCGYSYKSDETDYLVTWKSYDGVTIAVTGVAKDAIPFYSGEVPVIPEDEEANYVFDGWSPALAPATQDITYYALYKPIYKPTPDKLIYTLSSTEDYYSVEAINTAVSGRVVVPDTYEGLPVKKIEADAFKLCSKLESLVISKYIDEVSVVAFRGTSKFLRIEVVEENETYSSINGLLYSKDKTKLMIVPKGLTGEFNIPEGTLIVGASSLVDCTELTKVTIPNSVTEIERYAFQYCSKLEEVEIGTGVTSIGFSAFENLKSITSITVPGNVKYVSDCAFMNCTSLKELIFEEGVEYIEDYIFYGSDNLETLSIPHTLKHFGLQGSFTYSSTFDHLLTQYDNAYYIGDSTNPHFILVKAINRGITSCQIHQDTCIIHYDAFGYTDIDEITIPSGVFEIGPYAFDGCGDLITVHIEAEELTKIDDFTFWYCEALTSIALPSKVTSIGEYAFANCSSLMDVDLPDGMAHIGAHAFAECPFSSFKMPSGLVSLGEEAFYNCEQLKETTIPAVKVIPEGAFGYTDLTEIIIPDGVEEIQRAAFREVGATSVYLGKDVKELEEGFYKCRNIENYYVSSGSAYFKSVEGVLFDTTGTTLVLFPSGRGGSYAIPNDVTTLGYNAFSCSQLQSIIIGVNTVDFIPDEAFEYARDLTMISVASGNKKYKSFNDCLYEDYYDEDGHHVLQLILVPPAKMGYLTIYDGVPKIYSYTFYYSQITKVTFPKSIIEIEFYAFGHCDALTEFVYPGTLEEWDAIEKSEDWFIYSTSTPTLKCSDGQRIIHATD